MKFEKFTTSQPRKKRKQLYGMRIHSRKKLVRIHSSKQLRQQHRKRALPAKKGDRVKVLRGEFRKREGKIIDVDVKNSKIFIEGIIRKKQGGREVPAPLEPSNCILLEWAEPRKKMKRSNKGKADGKGPEAKRPVAPAAKPPAAEAQSHGSASTPAGAAEKGVHQHPTTPSPIHAPSHASVNPVK